METVKRSVVASQLDRERMNGQSREEFKGSKNTLYDTVMMDILHYTSV